MGRKRFTPADIIGHLRTVEIESGKGYRSQLPVGSWAFVSNPTSAGNGHTGGSAWIRPSG